MNDGDLLVFVTELARRQYVRRRVLEDGLVDASRLQTFTGLREACVEAARRAGLLHGRDLGDVGRLVLIRRATEECLRNAKGQSGALPAAALSDALESLVDNLSPFGDDVQAVEDWIDASAGADSKLKPMGAVYRTYRALCRAGGRIDTRDVNAAILRLLAGSPKEWPPVLRDLGGRIVFRSVRWLNPFEERFVAALKKRLGEGRVVLLSALPPPPPPPTHAQHMEDRLASRVRSEVMMGSDDSWKGWAENLGDALEMEDPQLAIESADRVSFTRSVGLYGEIEDAARRIRWEIDANGVAPERIALVVRNLGDYSDVISHVFARFGIASFYRRGLPVSSAPVVKNLLALLSLPMGAPRDRFCALLQSPSLRWAGFDSLEQRTQIAHDILAAGAPPRLTADGLRRCLAALYDSRQNSRAEAEARIAPAVQALNSLRALAAAAPLREHAERAQRLIEAFAMEANTREARIEASTRVFQLRALASAASLLEQIREATEADPQPRPLSEFIDLLERAMENATVAPGTSDESGVWVLNPYDAAGLRFDVVLIAGLNEGVFPAVPREDSVFSDAERTAIRNALTAKGIHLPQWGLPLSTVRIVQESILFLIALGAAREQLALSYRAGDTDGRELVPSDFFRSLWNLAGWPAQGGTLVIHPYDTWRLGALGPGSHLARHVADQQALSAYERLPLPGESYLATVPLALCRAPDEARQRIACSVEDEPVRAELPSADLGTASPSPLTAGIREMILVERRRERFFAVPPEDRPAREPYCGRLASDAARRLAGTWLQRHDEFSPTALENLARCRYRFLLGNIARLGALRLQEDAPDVLDRGKIIHRILEQAYRALTGDTAEVAALDPRTAEAYAGLCRTSAWAVETSPGEWKRVTRRPPGSGRRLALATFDPGQADAYADFARAVADAVFRDEEARGAARLGDPGVWATEKPKIRQIAANYLRLDADTAAGERRFPALFELRFGRQMDRAEPDTPALALGTIRVHGQIDRVDLLFDEDDKLSDVLVIDYKAAGRARRTAKERIDEVVQNLNCQLPIYGFVAQHLLFGRHDEPDLNARTKVVYHVQSRKPKEMELQFRKRLPLDQRAGDDDTALTELFVRRLESNVARIADSDFAVEPIDCDYCDFKHICRVDVNALSAAEGEAGGAA